jgi:hypothetical protein
MFKPFILALALCSFAIPAAANDYVPPAWPDLLHAMIRFRALDLSDDHILDEYARITDCELYKAFYSDDFKWNKVRTAMRDSAQQNSETFPITFGYEAPLELDRYDFEQKAYLFTERTTIKNINAFVLLEAQNPPCINTPLSAVPQTYRAVLDTALSLSGVPITQKDGEALLQRMQAEGNDSRRIYARFNLTLVYIEPWRKRKASENLLYGAAYTQSKYTDNPTAMRLDARLDSIDFFEDAAMTRLIHQYRF